MIKTIKEANQETKTLALSLYRDFIMETGATLPKNLETNYDNFLANNSGKILIAFADNEAAGFVELRVLPNKLRDEHRIVEITSLYVKPEFRKAGIGKYLIEKTEEECKKNTATKLVLYSGSELVEAHKFYERVGFKNKAFYFGKNVE